MSVPLTLLGLLEREPSHGYDLKRDYDLYFGRSRPLPFGQVYATLARLARDGKVVTAGAEPGEGPDRKRYVITEAGVSEFDTWLAEPAAPEPHLQTILFAKVVLALMLGKPAGEYLDAQRAEHLARILVTRRLPSSVWHLNEDSYEKRRRKEPLLYDRGGRDVASEERPRRTVASYFSFRFLFSLRGKFCSWASVTELQAGPRTRGNGRYVRCLRDCLGSAEPHSAPRHRVQI